MKKIFLILFIMIVLVGAAAAVFLATLDVDSFRPQIVGQIEKAAGKPVRLEKIRLGWRSGIALELDGFALLKEKGGSETLVEAGSAKAVLKLAPLLNREIQIAALHLDRPVVRLVMKPDGSFEGWEPVPARPAPVQGPGPAVSASEIPGVPVSGQTSAPVPAASPAPVSVVVPSAAPAPVPVPATQPVAALSLFVDEIRIRDGEVFFRDMSRQPASEITVRKIDADIDHVALDRPVDFNVRGAVFGSSQNLDVRGKLTVAAKDLSAVLSELRAELGLDPVEVKEVLKMRRDVATAGVLFPVEGTLVIESDSLKLDVKGMQDMAARVRFDRGKVRLEALPDPVENISLEAVVTPAVVRVGKFSAVVAGGKIDGQGAANIGEPANPAISFDAKADGLLLERLVPAPKPGEPRLRGRLSAAARGSLTGQRPEQVLRTLSADGTIMIEQGVLENVNVLREVFQQLSVIPGLVERLVARLPENYREKLRAKDTALNIAEIPFSVRDGVARLPRVDGSTDTFRLTGALGYGLAAGAAQGNVMLTIDPDLSGAMTRSVEELQYLMNERKEVQIPLIIQGIVPKVMVMPDIGSVAARIGAQKVQDVIGGYLKKAMGGDKQPPASGQTTSGAGPGTAGGESQSQGTGLLGELLRQGMSRVLTGEETRTVGDKTS